MLTDMFHNQVLLRPDVSQLPRFPANVLSEVMLLPKAGGCTVKVSNYVITKDQGKNWEAVQQNGMNTDFWYETNLKQSARIR